MKLFKDVINWLVWSSNDPSKVSLTVKGSLMLLLSFAAPLLLLFHFNTDLNPIVDQIALLAQQLLEVVGTIVGLYGLVRKLINTVR